MCGEGEGESVWRGGGGECVEGRRGRVCGVDSVELGLREWKEGKEGGGVSLGHTGVSLVSKVVHASRLPSFAQVPECPTDINDMYCIHLEVL